MANEKRQVHPEEDLMWFRIYLRCRVGRENWIGNVWGGIWIWFGLFQFSVLVGMQIPTLILGKLLSVARGGLRNSTGEPKRWSMRCDLKLISLQAGSPNKLEDRWRFWIDGDSSTGILSMAQDLWKSCSFLKRSWRIHRLHQIFQYSKLSVQRASEFPGLGVKEIIIWYN